MQLVNQILRTHDWPSDVLRLDDPALVSIYLQNVIALGPDHAANEPLTSLTRWMRLEPAQVDKLQKAGVSGLYDMAYLIDALVAKGKPARQTSVPAANIPSGAPGQSNPPVPSAITFTTAEAIDLRDRIGRGLGGLFPPAAPKPSP